MTEEELAAIEAEHQPFDMGTWTCCSSDSCSHEGNGQPWPCLVSRLVADVRGARHAAREFSRLMGEYIRLRAEQDSLLRAARDQGGAVGRSSTLADLLEALR